MSADDPQKNDGPAPSSPEIPANPEMANVSLNRPANVPVAKKPAVSDPANVPAALAPVAASVSPKKPVAAPAPTRIGKEPKKKQSSVKFLVGFAFFLLILFVLFLSLMVFVMSRGAGNNAVIAAFGLAPGAIKSFLLTVINLAFGFLSLLFFVLMVIGVFRLAGAKKDDKEKRGNAGKMILFSLLPFLFLVMVWFFLFTFISQLQIAAEKVKAEIIVLQPEDISNLQAPVEVTFSAIKVKQAISNSKLSVSGASWDLDGDGYFEKTVDASGEVTRLYLRRGFYNVGLSVQVVGEETPRLYALPLDVKNALFAAEPSTGTAPLSVRFDASGLIPDDVKMESIDWDFDGDGAYDVSGPKETAPRYTFEQIGTYKVALRLVDQNNTVQNYTREIEISPSDAPLLSARIDATPGLSGTAPFSVRFDGGNSTSLKGKIAGYEWDFGDGSSKENGKSVTHIYSKVGVYPLTLTVTEDSGKTSEITLEVEVQSQSSIPQAVIRTVPASAEGALSGSLPLKVSFSAADSKDSDGDIVDFEWDFNGDGEMDQIGQKTDHTFDTMGDFTVSLTVRDSEGQASSAALAVRVTQPALEAVIKAEPEEGTVPLTVHFDGSGSSAFEDTIVSYEWDFGDGTPPTITGATVDHRYIRVGTYQAKLKVVTSGNDSATVTRSLFVREIPLKACFEPSRDTGGAPLSVTFDPQCTTGGVATYSWDFGDGIESSSRKPAHTFENAGTYNVILTVADDKSNVSTYSSVITVQGTISN